MFKIFAIVIFSITLIACSPVKLTKEGEGVMVKSKEQVADCKKVGRVTTSLLDKVAGVKRSEEKVKKELEMLARNGAVEYGGNTIVPDSEVTEGKQSFVVYHCP
ncbi:DUF4156 domain-containing protein [Kaarinaea lacus]